MKKIIAIILCALIVVGALVGCSNTVDKQSESKLSVVTTIFPIYDWVSRLTNGTGAELTMLLDSGVDLHSFQPSADDIVNLSTCDMFIYVGGESDEWVEDALKEATNKDIKVINLMELLGNAVKEEELVEGMESEEEEEEDEPELDEHVWLSLKNAEIICKAISEQLAEINPENKSKYSENAEKYISELKALDSEYSSAVSKAKTKTLLFGDRFPFRYLVDDYNLKYYAAFAGCSAETEASFETIAFLAEKLNELELKCIMQIETSDGSIARTIRDTTKSKNQEILTLDSMQSAAMKDVENGKTYLSVMKDNLQVLKQALN